MTEHDGVGTEYTATVELRRLLDERGVEWGNIRQDGSESDYLTEWQFDGNEAKAIAIEWSIDNLSIDISLYGRTPQQAIDVTLGRGTCHMELPGLRGPAYTDVYVCSECGGEVMVGTVMGESDVPRWCPWCGRKVVDA